MTDVIDFGLYSDGTVGLAIFGMGTMDACFHCLGTTDAQMESDSMSASSAARNGAPIFKNQAGILPNPAAECCNWSNILHIRDSVMYGSAS